MQKFTFLVASARPHGNSEQLALIAAEQLEEFSLQWVPLRDYPLPPFQDLRHGESKYLPPEGNALELLQATISCDHLVFVTPVYWYSVPAPLKLYLDHWSHWMRVDSLSFREQMEGKQVWAISASAGPADEAEHMFSSLKLCANYLNMTWCGQVLGNGSAAGDVLSDSGAVDEARRLFTNVNTEQIAG